VTAPAPHLQDVLASVRRGRVAYVVLTREQKRALRDPEGKIALDVLRHLLGARPMTPERFPLTEQAFQAVARKIGYGVGQKRCRRMVRRLLATSVVVRAGQYRQPYRDSAARSGFCVALYKLGRRLRVALHEYDGGLRAPRFAKRKRPVGKHPRVKPAFHPRWWQHPLFGDLLGLPPPEIPRPWLRRMQSLDEASAWRSA
jgi:hypothetical protein